MLVIVLCRFSAPVGKYFFKIDQHYSYSGLDRGWLNPPNEDLAIVLARGWCYYSDFRQMLINAIASCLEARRAVSFWDKIVVSWHKKRAKALGWSLSAPPSNQYSFWKT